MWRQKFFDKNRAEFMPFCLFALRMQSSMRGIVWGGVRKSYIFYSKNVFLYKLRHSLVKFWFTTLVIPDKYL